MAVGSVGQVDRGRLEPTDHGLDLNTDIFGKLPRAEVGLLELQDELIDLGLVASATALDVLHPRPSPGSDQIENHGVGRTLTLQLLARAAWLAAAVAECNQIGVEHVRHAIDQMPCVPGLQSPEPFAEHEPAHVS